MKKFLARICQEKKRSVNLLKDRVSGKSPSPDFNFILFWGLIKEINKDTSSGYHSAG